MATAELRHGDLLVSIDAATGRLHFERASERLPWDMNLGGSLTVRRKAAGASEETHPLRLDALDFRRLGPAHVQWLGEASGAGLALNLEFGEEGLALTVSPLGTGDAEVISVEFPVLVRVVAKDREACWADYCQGSLFRPDGKPFRVDLGWCHATMRVCGFTAAGRSLAVIVDTPFYAEATVVDDGASTMASGVKFAPSLGTLAVPRRIRFLPLVGTGHVAIANAYRIYAQRHGLWKAFEERVDENPEVEKLRGTFVSCAGYWWDESADHVGVMKAMRNMGFNRGWLFSPKFFVFGTEWKAFDADYNHVSDEDIREIQALGYLCAPFLQVEEAGPSIGAEKFALYRSGERMVRWEIGDRQYYEIAKWRVPGMLPVFDDQLQACAGIHFDTLTAARLQEDWAERPYDRGQDAAMRMEIARYYRRQGKVVAAEGMRDWAIADVDLATTRMFTPYPEPEGRVWNVPLADLVYHDSTVRTHWEHSAYDDDPAYIRGRLGRRFHPFGNELMDLLTASPPVLFLEGLQYRYELKEVTLPDGTKDTDTDWQHASLFRKRFSDPRTQAALPKALRACQLNERHGAARMTSHRFVDPKSALVQESEFASGLHVFVNFGDEPFTLPDGRPVPARGAIVEE